MKKTIALVIVFISLSISSVVFAQDDVKKADQQNNTGGYTKSGQQVTAPANTQQPPKEPNGNTNTNNSSKSKAPTWGKIMYDRMDVMMATIGMEGKIYDAKGTLIGQYTDKGEYLGPQKEKLAVIKDGIISSADGKEIGRISREGKVTNAKGKLLGTIYDDGTIRNSKGSKLGSAPGVDKNIVAVMYFYHKKSSDDKKKGQGSGKNVIFEAKPIEKK
jgi:hypothetical protein